MVFPTNNLPTSSRFWAREVEKKVTNLESTLRSSDINNTTRDSQLSVTAGQALLASQQALSAAGVAGTAATNAANAADAALTAFNTANAASNAAATAATAASDANAEALDALQKIINLGSAGGPTINAANITAGSISADRISGGTITGITIQGNTISGGSISGTTITGGSISSMNSLEVPFGAIFGATVSSSGEMSTQTTFRRDELNGGGNTGASFTNGGFLVRTSSSERYKTDIQDAEFNLESVLQLQPKTFKLKEEVEEDPERAITYPGFIAEDIAGTALDVFVNYQTLPDGTRRPDGVRYAELTAALVSAMKQQNTTIKSLEQRLAALEAK